MSPRERAFFLRNAVDKGEGETLRCRSDTVPRRFQEEKEKVKKRVCS